MYIIINRLFFFICQTSFEMENKIFLSFINVRKNVKNNKEVRVLIENRKEKKLLPFKNDQKIIHK